MAQRKPIGKRLRFAIFARDQFTCRYCGRQADQVALHIDHIIPVAKGGTNDEQNLITACVECNLGKSDKSPTFTQPTESDRLRAAQEMHEQRAAAERAKQVLEAIQDFEQDLVNLWCQAFNETQMSRQYVKNLVSIARSDGVERLAEWLGIAAERLDPSTSDNHRIRYVYGIRRRQLEREQENAA